jgi:hypothetical protein
VFENRALRRIFGPRRDEVTGEWRKLHNEEHNEPGFFLLWRCDPTRVMASSFLRFF